MKPINPVFGWVTRLFGLVMGCVALAGIIYLSVQWLITPDYWVYTINGLHIQVQHFQINPGEVWTGIILSTVGLVILGFHVAEEVNDFRLNKFREVATQ